ncbi:hypothetical protein EDB85DRAFT_2274265 [Lactarius pseudohatsudake]|nr:hypothetical protein EDB85DRAFT_2274265 [Lactarius pseudohatsudake]
MYNTTLKRQLIGPRDNPYYRDSMVVDKAQPYSISPKTYLWDCSVIRRECLDGHLAVNETMGQNQSSNKAHLGSGQEPSPGEGWTRTGLELKPRLDAHPVGVMPAVPCKQWWWGKREPKDRVVRGTIRVTGTRVEVGVEKDRKVPWSRPRTVSTFGDGISNVWVGGVRGGWNWRIAAVVEWGVTTTVWKWKGVELGSVGLYCDTNSTVCIQQKDLGASCSADKECSSYNCLPDQTCGETPSNPRHLPIWVYVVIGVGIFGGMIATLVVLFIFHGR